MTHQIQNFDVKGGPQAGRDHLPLLREAIRAAGLHGFLIPHEDEYNNEYLPANAERLAWATGFIGSAGAAVVSLARAAVLVDGRYTVQVRAQIDEDLFEIADLVETGMAGWVRENAKPGERFGYDPRLHTPDSLARIREGAEAAGAELVAVERNLIDEAWQGRPPAPCAMVAPHPLAFAGEEHSAKRARIGEAVRREGAQAAVITDPASIAWLLNVRGGDVACSPLPLARVILKADGTAELFINENKLAAETRGHLGNQVAIRPEPEFADGLAALSGQKVRVDPASASAWVFDRLDEAGAAIQRKPDPVLIPKACKNATEIEGSRKAHIRDGAAITRFLHWLDTEAQSGEVDEIAAAIKLEQFRHGVDGFKDISFETISGAGPNGAMPHYRVNAETVRKLETGSLFLIDSGGQYTDGTTDITRTVPIGRPTAPMIEHFTRVLKGHIALARARFPRGTTGHQLDVLARLPLWEAGLDYDHGTGHGVGSYLGVHEGPQRIAKAPNAIALQPGMIVSNEPGYYRIGAYGIRIENLQYVTEPEVIEGGDREMMGFEALTLAPIHRGLIADTLMSPAELAWLDAYHAQVRKALLPMVEGEVASWLMKATEPFFGATP